MPPSRHIRLTEQEDIQLREIEQAPYFKPKVRLRAQVLRLSHWGSNIHTIASYTGRSRASVGRDLDRFEERGFEGLFDGRAPGNPPRITERMRTCMEQKLREERTWNATQLAEVLAQSFGVEVTPEKPSASISSRWATRGSALLMCPIKHQIPNRSGVKPEKIWRGLKGGGQWRDRSEVPR